MTLEDFVRPFGPRSTTVDIAWLRCSGARPYRTYVLESDQALGHDDWHGTGSLLREDRSWVRSVNAHAGQCPDVSDFSDDPTVTMETWSV